MNDQLPMFGPAISEDTLSAISSPESESGPTPSVSPDGPIPKKSGPDRVPASPSARPEKAKRSTTKGIFGQSGIDSFSNADRPSFSGNKSQQPALLAELLPKLRTCKKCGIERTYSEFYVNSKGHRRSICKECMKNSSRAEKRGNPEKAKKNFSSWRTLNRGRALVALAKFRAKQKGIPFDLDKDEIQAKIDGGACELTGIPFDLTKPRSWNAPSLDQIEPGAGYTKENTRVVLYSINVMANTWGHQRILEVAKAITERRRDRSNDLSRKLAAKLKEATDKLGSTLFELTWSEHITPSGHVIPRLVASAHLTRGNVFIGWPTPRSTEAGHSTGSPARAQDCKARLEDTVFLALWPTPQSSDMTGGGQAKRSDGRANLNDFAMLAGWATAKPRDYRSENEASLHREGHPPDLSKQVLLAGWATPASTDGARGGEMTEAMSGTSLVQMTKMAGWPTPMAGTPAQKGYNEAGNSDSSRKTVEMCQWPVDPSTAFGETPIGYLLGPNGWEIVPASGQLNAAHSRWLMGLPRAWDDSGVTAMASSRKPRKRS
jgi:hypothetical protein